MLESHQRIEYIRPFLYPKQERAFFNDKRYSYVEASTKAGKTHACIVWLVEAALLEGFAGWNGWWVAPSTAQAKIAMRRIKQASPKEFYHSNESEAWIEFSNGARLWFKSASHPDSLYGEDVHRAVLDEASRARYDSFKAIRSTLTATGGQFRLIGNLQGKSNWFYMACRGVERGRENAHFERITCWDAVDAGLLDRDEVEDARLALTEGDFQELYEAKAQDDAAAFIPSAFVEKAIERGLAGTVQPHGVTIMGGDPSQGKKDPAAFCIRRGSVVTLIEEHKGMDEFGFMAHALRLMEVHKPAAFFMDGTGFGTTIAKLIKEKGGRPAAITKAFHMAERSTYPDEYQNKRAECWGEGRKALISTEDLYSLPDDDGLAIEMTCIRTVDNTSGRLQLEDKDDLAARGYDSPNKADAWAMTYAEPVSFAMDAQINYPQGRVNRNMA